MTKWLITHLFQGDPALEYTWQDWEVKELDRAAVALGGPFNEIRQRIQAAHGGDNTPLIAWANKMGFNTIIGHSHVHEATTFQHAWLSGDVETMRFLNDGCFLAGPDGCHYVLFPKDKVACISDLHVGMDESDSGAIMAFLGFAKTNGWTVYFAGDSLDLWARGEAYILTHCGEVVDAIANYPNKIVIPGNHDGLDVPALRRTLRIPDNQQTPWYKVITTNDAPSLVGWPNEKPYVAGPHG